MRCDQQRIAGEILSQLNAKRFANPSLPSFIIETDLASPQQNYGSNSLTDKDRNSGYDSRGSLNAFLSNDQMADYAAVWNLNVDANDDEQKWQ